MTSTTLSRWMFGILWLWCVASIGGAASAAERRAPEFPSDPESWLNSGPITVSSLKGKAAFLWFFEEGCPTCRAKWPGLLATAQKFQGQPVIFIAVNSGTSRDEVAEYAQDIGCNWPIIVDGTREYEKQALGNEISLQNIYQACVIRADGSLQGGDAGNVEKTIEKALKGAKWKVDPADVPDGLKPAWQSIELGDYPAAASQVKKSLLSKKPDIKSGAEKLKAVVQAEIDVELAAATEALGKDQKWRAYQTYLTLGQNFNGYDLPASAVEAKKKLSTDPVVKKELLAYQDLAKTKKVMASGKPGSHKMVVMMLEKIIKNQGGTTASSEAKELLARFNAAGSGAN